MLFLDNLVCFKNEYVITYSKNNRYMVYNTKKKWKEGHTHIGSYKQALDLVKFATKRQIPNRVNKYFLISLSRIINIENKKDEEYLEKIQLRIKAKSKKNNYYNAPKKVR